MDDEYLNGYARLCGIHATGVYMSLCRHANKDQTAFPSKKLMGEELNISERSVYSALKTLEEWGIISITQQGRKEDGSFRNLLYTLKDKSSWVPKPPSANGADGTKQHSPSANYDTHRRHMVPNKDTHNKDTHIRIVADATPEKKVTPQMREVFALFSDNPARAAWPLRIHERKSAQILFDTYDLDVLYAMLGKAKKYKNEILCPQINSPAELLEKIPKLEKFLKDLQRV